MMREGKIKGSKVGKPLNASAGQARLLQVQIGPQVQTVQLVPQAGEDVNPVADSLVVILESGAHRFGVATFDGITPACAPGERELYSSASGSKKARVKLKAGGTIYVGGPTHDLRTALQNLVQGVQGATAGGNPIVDATGKIALALTQIQGLLDSAP